MSRFVRVGIACAACAMITTSASAGIFDFDPGSAPILANNIGDFDRGVQVLMTADQFVSGGEIMVDPLNGQNFDLTLTIYNSDAAYNRGGIVSTSTTTHGDSGLGFYGSGAGVTLQAGQYYEFAFDVAGLWGFGNFDMEFYLFNAPGDPPFDVGPFQVRNGLFGGDPSNTVMPHISMVPTPASLALLGAAGLIGCRRRRRA